MGILFILVNTLIFDKFVFEKHLKKSVDFDQTSKCLDSGLNFEL